MPQISIENKAPIYEAFNGSSKLLVSFGGIRQGLGIPVFEFFNSLSTVDCDKLFIRDFNQAWYHQGVDSRYSSIDALKDYLAQLIKENEYARVCFIGNSMGGYAAILLGAMLNVNVVLAFAPQTFINKLKRLLHWDHRWPREMKGLHFDKNKNPELFDLKKVLKSIDFKTEIKVYYSNQYRLDKVHAKQLKNFKQVELIGMQEGDHEIVRVLRDSGKLLSIISSSLQSN
ncbi:MAG: alpha/beta hydrolase [Fulvivirga sp.]|uniref:alpha/beta hydrolase n=1 Tax=Fulvivirga sp. TaxID=1931237 RepID=UPI0032EB69EA